MTLLVLGVNHKTAPLALRERLLFLPTQWPAATASLLQHPKLQGALLLSTCHRSELYLQSLPLAPAAVATLVQQILEWWGHYQSVPCTLFKASLYWYADQAAIQHLMRVALGLDAFIVGETQIFRQLKQAYRQAQQQRALSSCLHCLFQRVFATAKQTRRKSGLGQQPLSIATLACRLARQQTQDWSSASVLLIGAGETISLVAQQLQQQAVGQLIVAARSSERATALAQRMKARLITLQALPQWLPNVAVVISATCSAEPILACGTVAAALQQRAANHSPLLLLDLAVPRDIAAESGHLPGVQLYTIDDLQIALQTQRSQQQAAVARAETMVSQAAEQCMQWLATIPRRAIIRQFREEKHQQRQRLEQQALAALQQGVAAEQVVQQLAYRLTNQLLHQPTKLLQWLIQPPTEQLWQPAVAPELEALRPLEKKSVDRKVGS